MSEPQKKPSFSEKPGFSSREIRKNDNRSFLILVIFTLVVVGSMLIGLIYGGTAVLTALPFLLGGALLILLPWGVLTLIEKWREKIESS
jgi:fatty acid desaturase